MKRLFVIALGVIILVSIASCNQKTNASSSTNVVTPEAVDSLALQLHKLDSLYNSGDLLHMDIYKLEKLKSVEFSVQSVNVGNESLEFINLRKDCGGNYYYNWEDARILADEVKYLLKAIDTIKANSHRETNHEERYAYVTKDDIRLFAQNNGGGAQWSIGLSVDYRKSNSEITLSDAELEKFVELLNKGLAKIHEISK